MGEAASNKRASFGSASFKVAERDYRSLVESIADYAIFMIGPQGRVETWNSGASSITGYCADEIVGADVSCLYPEDERACGKPAHDLERARAAGRFEEDAWRIRKDGSPFFANLVMTPIRDGERIVGFATVTRDLTRREVAKEAVEEPLRPSEDQARQAQKMEAVGRLASAVAHDFNNVLSVIMTYCDLLSTGLGSGHAAVADVEEIQKAAGWGAQLTRQLLTYARRQAVTPQTLDLNEVVSGVEYMLRKIAGERVELVLRLKSPLGTTLADRAGLERALMNLVVNARDAMPDGGKVTIETASATFDPGAGSGAGEHLVLTVTDTGVGMDDATRARVFEPFFTTKPAGEGTGLGLATVLGVVRQSGGHVRVRSEPGAGTTFWMYLPRIARIE